MEGFNDMMSEFAKNVSEITKNVNSIETHKYQLRKMLTKSEVRQSRETSIAAKQTAENILKLIINNAKETKDEENLNSTSFVEFKSNAEERISTMEDALTTIQSINEWTESAPKSST